MPSAHARPLPAARVGRVLADTIREIVAQVPPGLATAVDLQLEFKSVRMNEEGFLAVVFGGASSEDTMTLKLSTRIHVGDSHLR